MTEERLGEKGFYSGFLQQALTTTDSSPSMNMKAFRFLSLLAFSKSYEQQLIRLVATCTLSLLPMQNIPSQQSDILQGVPVA